MKLTNKEFLDILNNHINYHFDNDYPEHSINSINSYDIEFNLRINKDKYNELMLRTEPKSFIKDFSYTSPNYFKLKPLSSIIYKYREYL